MAATEKIQADFDRLAVLPAEGWSQNNHYYAFLLRYAPASCGQALEIGCGTGGFSRLLAQRAQHVLALDLSPQMIRVAQERSMGIGNIEYQVADALKYELPTAHFDCIVTSATLHHLPLEEMLGRMKEALTGTHPAELASLTDDRIIRVPHQLTGGQPCHKSSSSKNRQ